MGMTTNDRTTRTFSDAPAVRERVPLWLGLYGASGSGKTFSALRLATGIQRVTGGEIFVIDTEARRALAVADKFKFRHVVFDAPFSPLDYLAAVEQQITKGAKVIVIDSMSHEHEGPGGVLEWQAAEVERHCEKARQKGRDPNPDAYKMLAWQPPKSARRRMINTFLQMPVNFVFCFRAKEKTKPPPKGERDVVHLGFMPIAGEELVYEMTATALLLPGAYGVPTWHSREVGEQMMIKRPEQFRDLIKRHEGQPLSEDMGEAMARWAAGDAAEQPKKTERPPEPKITPEEAETIDRFRDRFRDAENVEQVNAIARELAKFPKGGAVRTSVNAAYKAADARCKGELPTDAEPPPAGAP